MSTPPPDLNSLRINRDAPAATRDGGSHTKLIVTVIVVVVVAALALAGVAAMKNRPLAVDTAVVASAGGGGSSIAGTITANGYVVARTKASVAPKIGGRLVELNVSEGSRVHRGEVLARLEAADYQAALQLAKAGVLQVQANLVNARASLARAEALAKQNLVSQQELDAARTLVAAQEAGEKAAQAQVGVAQANLENTNVRAPFDGTVLRKDAELGEIVAPSMGGGGLTRTAIVTMADLATLEVEVDVNEAYIAQVRGGQEARITLDAYPDTSFAGRVRQVVPTADREKATVQVKVSILDRDPRILPEMGAKVEFVPAKAGSAAAAAAAPSRLVVPETAVVHGAAGTFVWVVETGIAKQHPVALGTERGDKVDVKSGLTGGETIVLSPPATLKDGARVKVSTPSS